MATVTAPMIAMPRHPKAAATLLSGIERECSLSSTEDLELRSCGRSALSREPRESPRIRDISRRFARAVVLMAARRAGILLWRPRTGSGWRAPTGGVVLCGGELRTAKERFFSFGGVDDPARAKDDDDEPS